MRPVADYTGTTITSATKRIKGRIDAEHTVHVMHQLSNIYSRPIDAVLREYSTNAWDSHVAAGTTRPIEVTLPTIDRPKLVIRDHGVGLGMTELEETYLSYGASDKRDTDEQTGSLGFGSKAAVAYAPLGWEVAAVRDGYKILATVYKDEIGVPEMGILFEGPVDAPNGVTITVPVEEDDIDEFVEAAETLFWFWPKGSVLVNGEEPTTIWEDSRVIWLDDSVALLPSNHRIGSTIVMGNVPYRLPYSSAWGHHIVAFVEMGAVAFTPSREELNYVDRTEALVTELLDYVNIRATDQIVAHVSEALTPWERLSRYFGLNMSHVPADLADELKRRLAPVLPKQFKDYPSGGHREFTDDGLSVWVDAPDRPRYIYSPGSSRNNVERGYRVTPATFGLDRGNYEASYTRIVITDFPYKPKTLSPMHRYHLARWAEQNGGSYRTKVVVLPGPISEVEFLDGWVGNAATWEQVKEATPRPKAERGSGRSKTYYSHWVGGDPQGNVIEDGIAGYRTVLYTTGGNPGKWSTRHPEAVVVSIHSRQVDKFLRLYPHAREAYAYDQERVAAVTAALTDYDKLAMNIGSSWAWLKKVRAEDPELAQVLAAVGVSASNRRAEAARLGISVDPPALLAELEKRYPLLSVLDRGTDYAYYGHRKATDHLDHVELYVNAVWRELEYQNIENIDDDVVDVDTSELT